MYRPIPTLLVALSALGAILGQWFGDAWLWLHYLCKPLTTALLLWLVLSAKPPISSRYRRAVALGMGLSLIGDVCLMLPMDLFVPGLLAFLAAHLSYIAAFAPGTTWKRRMLAFLPLSAVAALNLAGLLPRVGGDLRIPVLAYVLVLVSMATMALARLWTPALASAHPRSARAAAVGALLFVFSDSLLAWDRFGGGVPLSAWLVLGSYFLAQWCIARSVAAE